MTPIAGQPILTAAEMRAAEQRAIDAGTSVTALMERAGAGVAEAVRRLAGDAPVLVLCGPGNNGGDGYVAARILRANGVAVRVAATGAPMSEAAIQARTGWDGPVETLADAAPAPVVLDAIFGTGLSRRVDGGIATPLAALVQAARLSITVDVPTGLATDTGDALIDTVSHFDITLALGALKPVHVLAASAQICGTVRLVEIGLDTRSGARAEVIDRPTLQAPGIDSTKYTRGMVAVVGGIMPGAAALASEAAMRAGAGYVLLLSDTLPPNTPHALVCRAWAPDALADARIGAILIGPGLGRDDAVRSKLAVALASDRPLVIDGDALHLLEGRTFHDRRAPTILTPHGGEFVAVFGAWSGSKIEAARAAAATSGAVVVFKGADTVIADPDGSVVVAPHGSSWLSTAGTGDVLAGAVAALAASDSPLARHARAAAAVWMHGAAARRLGSAFLADDLAREISAVRAAL
ncbi:bifunctional ADP-dependent NAD(P)H-hydrate dehydratase/NAD(P)H-hydrate epimerase [Sphingomonas echinoides]|uniref:Bifunctional NAD(P)H-hydrate repair enzyme n=1 Tax=Sphingomonas echinoides TaxID=59803 RepID=A0ABU4PK53_9SPHN|nr:bifunctional ADP-dependent NAD(P)H-hydrate dehydratase/NAD(P)H-hydrate epimerase [Sphingomonas echinoides]MDX5984466.1 bifunctional ADP-dependent NAD(P)H-hydrate dehydratase/NAD(P)H-hydrate epimerase [Sphingomonas echinoides]